MDTIAVPLSPDLRDALVGRLTPTLGWARAQREVARAAAGQPTARVEQAIAELWAELRPAVAAIRDAWTATPTASDPLDGYAAYAASLDDEDQAVAKLRRDRRRWD